MASRVDAYRSGSHDQELLGAARIRDRYAAAKAEQLSRISGCRPRRRE
jgi:hypothetical protein